MKQLTEYISESILADDDALNNRKMVKTVNNSGELFKEIRNEIIRGDYKEGDTIDLNFIDVSKLKYIGEIGDRFFDIKDKGKVRLADYNYDVSEWDVSNVEGMYHLFFGCHYFDCDLSKWNVKNLTSASGAFAHCFNFKGKGLEKWRPKKLRIATAMFRECHSFNADISKWGCDDLSTAEYMFYNCQKFNQDLSSWKWPSTSRGMFMKCPINRNKNYKPHL